MFIQKIKFTHYSTQINYHYCMYMYIHTTLTSTMWIRNRTQIPHNINRIHPHLLRLLHIKHITQLSRIPKEHIKRHLQPQHGIIQLQRISHRLVVQRDLTGRDICADDLFQFIVVETETFDGVHFEIVVVAEIVALVFGG